MAEYGFLVLLIWEIFLTALAALVVLKGWQGMVLAWGLLTAGIMITRGESSEPWLMLGIALMVLVLGLGMEFWLKQKTDIQGLVHLETGVVGMFFLVALGWAMLPLALMAGALCGGLILRRYKTVPRLKGWLLVLLGERLFFSLLWLVLGNLI